jgi:hypothetical protein
MPEKIFKNGPFARFATEGLERPPAAGGHRRVRRQKSEWRSMPGTPAF